MKVRFFKIPLILFCLIMMNSCSQESLVENVLNDAKETPATNRVSLGEALTHADRLLNKIQGKKTRGRIVQSVEVMTSASVKTRSSVLDTAYYIVNYADNGGFAILGADRRLDPVYAVSEEGHLSVGDTATNPGLKMYFQGLEYATLALGDSLPTGPGGNIEIPSGPGEDNVHSEKYVAPLLTTGVRRWNLHTNPNKFNIYEFSLTQVAIGMICSHFNLPKYYEYVGEDGSITQYSFNWPYLKGIIDDGELNNSIIPDFFQIIGSPENLNTDYYGGNEGMIVNYKKPFLNFGFKSVGDFKTFTTNDGKKWIENHYSPLLMIAKKEDNYNGKIQIRPWVIDGFIDDWWPGYVDEAGNEIYGGDGVLFHCVWGVNEQRGNGYYKFDGKLTPFFNHNEDDDDPKHSELTDCKYLYDLEFCSEFNIN